MGDPSRIRPEAATAFVPAPRLDSLAGARIGLLGNRKKNNSAFFAAIGEELRAAEPTISLRFWEKPSVYGPVARRTAAEVIESCDALISGLGD